MTREEIMQEWPSDPNRIEKATAAFKGEDGLGDYTKEAATLRDEIDAVEMDLDKKKARLKVISEIILKTLDIMEADSHRAHGILFFKERKTSVTTPKTPEEKELLFQFLRDKGIFLEFASVNSQSLNKLYKDLAETAAKEGVLDFKLPGVGEPTEYINLKMRRA